MTNSSTPSSVDPWRDSPPQCVVYPQSSQFLQLLQSMLDGQVRVLDEPQLRHNLIVLVDCREFVEGMAAARHRYPTQPLVGVLAEPDAELIVQLLMAGADGVISITEPLDAWLECLNIVRGGARWLSGPGLEVSLEQKHASYQIARHERHSGDITMRTKLFLKGRLADKCRG